VWPQALARYSYDGTVVGQGTLYALPKDLGPFVMVYNKDIFDPHDVAYPPTDGSWTWDQALEDYQALIVLCSQCIYRSRSRRLPRDPVERTIDMRIGDTCR
jgi:hypothetical protein